MFERKDPLSGFGATSPPEGADKPDYRKRFRPGLLVARSVGGLDRLEKLPVTSKSLSRYRLFALAGEIVRVILGPRAVKIVIGILGGTPIRLSG